MGNDLHLGFVFRKGEAVRKLEDLRLSELLTAVAADIYSGEELAEMARRIISSVHAENYGRVEIKVGDSYWFGITAYAEEHVENVVNISLLVEDYYILNEPAMSDFAERAIRAFDTLKPWYGYAALVDGLQALQEVIKEEDMPYSHVAWLNYYHSDLVERIGREKILSALEGIAKPVSGVKLTEFQDGGIAIVSGKLPGTYDSVGIQQTLERLIFGKLCKYDLKNV